jgi:large subunit ribosomal protein L10
VPTERKADSIEDITALFNQAIVSVVTEYRGLKVSEITDLRRKLRPSGPGYHVAKNTLARLAAKKVGWEGLDEVLVGPTAIAFVNNDLVKGIKDLLSYQKDSKVFVIKAGILGGKVIKADRLEDLIKLPSKEELIAKMLGSLNAPATNLVSVLSQPPQNLVNVMAATPRNLVNVLNQIKVQLEQANA